MNEFDPNNKRAIFLISAFYILCALTHFFFTSFYIQYMPHWIEPSFFWVYFSGFVEIVLAILLWVPKARKGSAWALVVMLFLYLFLVHIPTTIGFFKVNSKAFTLSMVRNPLQLLLIYWAYLFTK